MLMPYLGVRMECLRNAFLLDVLLILWRGGPFSMEAWRCVEDMDVQTRDFAGVGFAVLEVKRVSSAAPPPHESDQG